MADVYDKMAGHPLLTAFGVDLDDVETLLDGEGIESPTEEQVAQGILQEAMYQVCGELGEHPSDVLATIQQAQDGVWEIWFWGTEGTARNRQEIENEIKEMI